MTAPTAQVWRLSHRADPAARQIADRHYSRQRVGSPQFVPPGRCLVLVAEGAYWVTSWPFAQYVKHRWAGAWICSAFRKEGSGLASDMIRAAVAATRAYFGEPPPLGMVTFVDANRVRHKRDPGRCFRRAGFISVGTTKGGLIALQLLPDAMPSPMPPLPMIAPTARDRHAEHERTGQPCNCGTRGSDMAQAVAERIVAKWYPSISPKLYRDKLTESIATALRAERAAALEEAYRWCEDEVGVRECVLRATGSWLTPRWYEDARQARQVTALRARGEAGG